MAAILLAMDAQSNKDAPSLWLTVDQGNSATKLVAWERSGGIASVLEHVTLSREELLAGGLGGSLARRDYQGIAFSSVACRGDQDALVTSLGSGAHISRPDCGLVLAVRNPETVGADRLFAARGAVELARGSGALVVVDAGTALTVDCVRDGVFLGGAIAPGPALLSSALESGGAQLFEVSPEPDAPALGRETREALEAGVAVGFLGAAKELVQRQIKDAAMQSGSPPTIFLTGGARRFLCVPEPFVEGELVVDPELVHRGLLAALWSELEEGSS